MASKGQKFKYWTAEEKYKIINPALELEKSTWDITRETGLSNGMINNWIKAYRENGMEGTYYVDDFDDSIIGSDVKPFYHEANMKNHIDALQNMLQAQKKEDIKAKKQFFTVIKALYIPQWHLIMNIKIIT